MKTDRHYFAFMAWIEDSVLTAGYEYPDPPSWQRTYDEIFFLPETRKEVNYDNDSGSD